MLIDLLPSFSPDITLQDKQNAFCIENEIKNVICFFITHHIENKTKQNKKNSSNAEDSVSRRVPITCIKIQTFWDRVVQVLEEILCNKMDCLPGIFTC